MSRRLFTGSLALIGAMAAVQLPVFAQAPPPACAPGQAPSPQLPCTPAPGDPGGSGGGIVPCAAGQQPTAQFPCTPIPGGGGAFPCAAGQQPTPQFPCTPVPGGPGGPGGGIVPCAAGQQPTPQFPCTPIPGGGPGGPGGQGGKGPQGGPGGGNAGGPPCEPGQQSTADDPCFVQGPGGPGGGQGGGQGGPGGPPSLKGGFLNKVWKFNAEVDHYDAASDILNCTITKILNLPAKFKDQDDDIVDSDSFVTFTATTKVYGPDGKRVAKETKYDGLLDNAETVRVQGKIAPPSKWKEDEDGTLTPTVRAKKVFITG